ncbi:MAG: hypothetical protein HHJ12_17735 [Glaciimonas sp.]|nr:hypothetical protein [Glaciimonas sp.]
MKKQLSNILIEAIKTQDPFLDNPVDLSLGRDAELYSDSGQLDSLSLVTIIADLEQQLYKSYGVKVRLANERDLSIENSPFNTFGRMLDFIEERVREEIQNRVVST